MGTLAHDLKYAFRLLRKSPGYALTAVAVLAVGIGASSAIFSLLDAALLRPLPYRDSSKLVWLWERPDALPAAHNSVSPLNFADWREQNTTFESMAAVQSGNVTVTGMGDPQQFSIQGVTAGFFEMLGVTPQAGRIFTAAEERSRVIVISYRLAQRRFGGVPQAIDASMTLNGQIYTIVGVLPPLPTLFRENDIWRPFPINRAGETRNGRYLRVVARLKPGVSIDQARADMAVIAGRIAQLSPETSKGWGVGLGSLQEELTAPISRPLRSRCSARCAFYCCWHVRMSRISHSRARWGGRGKLQCARHWEPGGGASFRNC